MERYRQVPHTADLAAAVSGKDMETLFSNSAFAMFDLMGGANGGEEVKVEVKVEGPDKESLLIAFLNELLYISYVKNASFMEFAFDELTETRLKGRASGHVRTEKSKREIKAATYHDVRIEETEGGYEVTVVFDV